MLPTYSKKDIDLVICIPGNSFSGDVYDAHLNFFSYLASKRISFTVSRKYSPVIYHSRMMCMGLSNLKGLHVVPFERDLVFKDMLLLDSDVVFKPEHFEMLMDANKEFISGFYFQPVGNLAVCEKIDMEYFMKYNGHKMMFKKDIEEKIEPFEVDYCGLGFTLIRDAQQNIAKLEYPLFISDDDCFLERYENYYDACSEDVCFARKIRKAGMKMYVHPKCEVGHYKSMVFTGKNF